MRLLPGLILGLLAIACNQRDQPSFEKLPGGPNLQPSPKLPEERVSLREARKGFQTRGLRKEPLGKPVDQPPAAIFEVVRYDSPVGKLPAYLSPDPQNGKKNPAIIWITGGDCNTIDKGCWAEAPPHNDQSAGQFRKAGVVMMFPSLRGGNDHPGPKEGFLGEIDDILAAREFLAKQKYVDPNRIYLGGHSTGGTTVLLCAAMSDSFRAVFSFGPVEDVSGYGPDYLPFDFTNPREIQLRSPGQWLHSMNVPVLVFEGTEQGNLDSLMVMSRDSKNPKLHFYPVRSGNHFNILAPLNRLLAEKVIQDSGATCNIQVSAEEVKQAMGR